MLPQLAREGRKGEGKGEAVLNADWDALKFMNEACGTQINSLGRLCFYYLDQTMEFLIFWKFSSVWFSFQISTLLHLSNRWQVIIVAAAKDSWKTINEKRNNAHTLEHMQKSRATFAFTYATFTK